MDDVQVAEFIAVEPQPPAWVRIRPQEKNGPTIITPEPQRKLKLSSGPVAVLVWAATLITSLAHGLTWTTASGQRQLRNWQCGRHLRAG